MMTEKFPELKKNNNKVNVNIRGTWVKRYRNPINLNLSKIIPK